MRTTIKINENLNNSVKLYCIEKNIKLKDIYNIVVERYAILAHDDRPDKGKVNEKLVQIGISLSESNLKLLKSFVIKQKIDMKDFFQIYLSKMLKEYSKN